MGAILSRDIEDLSGRLEEAGSNTGTQIELNKKREAELSKLKGELEEANIQHEGTLAALRSKHNNTMAEMGENIDGLNKMKAKAEKDKAGMERDLMDTQQGLDEAMRERANTERNCKMTQGQIVEAEAAIGNLSKSKISLSTQLEDTKRLADAE